MRIGTDGRKFPGAGSGNPVAIVERAKALGLEGVFFRTVLDMSPTLDHGVFRAVRQRADELGLYLETGLGKVNPFATPEAPELRAAGDGDILLGFRRMMEAAAVMNCRELWASTANSKASSYFGRLAHDRFRTDVTWGAQLEATQWFLRRLAPVATDLGIHINLETHEEITSFEVVRLVEAVGPHVLGIVFDTANVLQRAEHPVFAARRVAPYVRQTHIKDAGLTQHAGGLSYQIRMVGEGVVDFDTILPILAAANPDVNLSIEYQQERAGAPSLRHSVVEIYDQEFLAGHPDLTVEEFTAYMEMVRSFDLQIASGERADWETVAHRPLDADAVAQGIVASASHVRRICEAANLPL